MANNKLVGEFIGIDVGASRIGIARIHTQAGIAEPLLVLNATSESIIAEILKIGQDNGAVGFVVGVARGLDGQETAQTAVCLEFARLLKTHTKLPVFAIDEAGTSIEAEQRILQNGAGSIDSVAAAIFLEDFVAQKNSAVYEVEE